MDREALLKTLRQAPPAGLRIEEIAEKMNADQKAKHRLVPLLAEAIDEGVVEKAPGKKYRLVVAHIEPIVATSAQAGKPVVLPKGQIAGRIIVHPAGYGFVVREDGEEDAFVAARWRGAAMDGDRVAISTWMGFKGVEGRVESIIERGRAKLTGILQGRGKHLHLVPDDPRIVATTQGAIVSIEGGDGGAKEGEVVVVSITHYPTRPEDPMQGRVTHVLGSPDDPRTEVEKVIICADIPDEFPADVAAEGARAPSEVSEADLADRMDLRELEFLTIDPETARDFDDAICLEAQGKVKRLWVAVADVSQYVRPGTTIDREAVIRGCSVYLPNRAIPMLPEQLSSGICSLNPNVDRLAMVARVDVDDTGAVSAPLFCAAVIRSKGRLDYPGVAAALGGDFRGPRERYRPFLPTLEKMLSLSRLLRARRTERGALDFELPEARVILDADDPLLVRDVVQSRANPEVVKAYQLVEDCMLAANESVARHFRDNKIDTLWRVHAVPKDERLEALAELAEAYGLRFSPSDGKDPKKMRNFLLSLKTQPTGAQRALNFLVLRTLKQAAYDVVNVGHFGLAATDYVHFTSPIRRYPDLIVHRLLKISLKRDGLPAGGITDAEAAPSRPELQAMAVSCSQHERRAMLAEREVVDLYRAFLMRDRVGEEFTGTISGVTSFGVFVQIEAPFVEGLVKITSLGGDSFEFDEKAMRIVGRRSGRVFSLGDTISVKVENVSIARRQLDLSLVGVVASAFPDIEPQKKHWDQVRAKTGFKRPPAKADRSRGGKSSRSDRSGGRPSGKAGGRPPKGAGGGRGKRR